MSAISLTLLLPAVVAVALGGAALHTARDLRRRLAVLQEQVAQLAAAAGEAGVPAARPTPTEEIRLAVADALAEERERELAEARAFWAAQDARDEGPDGAAALLEGRGTEYEISAIDAALLDALVQGEPDGDTDGGQVFVPRQLGPDEIEPAYGPQAAPESESAELAAARRRHPSQPDFTLRGEPVARKSAVGDDTDNGAPAGGKGIHHDSGNSRDNSNKAHNDHDSEQGDRAYEGGTADATDPADATGSDRTAGTPAADGPAIDGTAPAAAIADDERTIKRLAELAAARTPLTDVRPGPLGTLDVYVFADGTTVCMSPSHPETTDRLARALADGEAPALLGGSGVSGSYTLTFTFGGENVYILADRVIASL